MSFNPTSHYLCPTSSSYFKVGMVAGVLLAMVGFVITYATVASTADRYIPYIAFI